MASKDGQLIYIGTSEGLYQAVPDGKTTYKVSKLGQIVSEALKAQTPAGFSTPRRLLNRLGLVNRQGGYVAQ
jgi:hypothetical protein